MEKQSKCVKITRFSQKHEPGESLDHVFLVACQGLTGDYHQGGDRQLCLLDEGVRQGPQEEGLCHKRFKENLLIRGLADLQLRAGSKIAIGDAVLEITSYGKECYAECPLFTAAGPCALSRSIAFAKVVKSGEIHVGDSVSVSV